MKPDVRFQQKPKSFWASVRTLSQHIGYSRKNSILTPTPSQMAKAFNELGLNATKLIAGGKPTTLANDLEKYFQHRAETLMRHIEPRLMDAARAKKVFQDMKAELQPTRKAPMNKQKGEKKAEAFLTGIINPSVETRAFAIHRPGIHGCGVPLSLLRFGVRGTGSA